MHLNKRKSIFEFYRVKLSNFFKNLNNRIFVFFTIFAAKKSK